MKKDRMCNRTQRSGVGMFLIGVILCLILTVMGIPNQVQAQEWPVEGHDGIYVSGSFQPEAGTTGEGKSRQSDDPNENGSDLNLYQSQVAAYYGTQLETANEKKIYTELAAASQKGSIKAAASSSTALEIRLSQAVAVPEKNSTASAAYQKLRNEVGKAIDAFIFDYSENYWIYGYRWMQIYSSTKSEITGISLWFTDYYESIRSEFGITDTQLRNLEQKITGKSRYEIVKKAYEEVIRLVIYPSDDKMAYHTITGGLLDKYGHMGVCDCYARIFRLLCQKKGIACILVPGGSEMQNGEVEVDHIWNYVQMEDGKWYLVDCTWDDLGTDTPRMTHLLAGSGTPGLEGQKVGQNHLPVGRFTNSSYTPFSVPVLSTSAYQNTGSVGRPTRVTLNYTNMNLTVGVMQTLSATVQPSSFPVDELTWHSSDESIVAVTGFGAAGKAYVTAKSPGTAEITVVYKDTVYASCLVTVKAKTKAAVYKVKLNVGSLPLQVKKSTKALKVTSCQSGDRVKSWKSSNTRVVKVDKNTGKLTAVRTGSAVITVITQKGAKASCKVTVQKGKVKTRKLTLTQRQMELKKGRKQTIKVVRTPLTATDKITYKSSNKKVVSVSSKGKMTARKKGKATITIRTSGGASVKLKVQVK